jgi:molecular chaperone GrpE
MKENEFTKKNGAKLLENEKENIESLADLVDIESKGQEDESSGLPKFKFNDRRFWVDEEDEDEKLDDETISDKPSYVQELEKRAQDAEKRLAEYVKAYKEEVQVEWERTKERINREAERNLQIERRKIVANLLDVLDMLDMSLDSAKQKGDLDALLNGLQMVSAEFEKKLISEGLEPVDTQGVEFDPRVHEALTTEETTDPSVDGKIVKVFKKGYLLGGELVRPAMVSVARLKG